MKRGCRKVSGSLRKTPAERVFFLFMKIIRGGTFVIPRTDGNQSSLRKKLLQVVMVSFHLLFKLL